MASPITLDARTTDKGEILEANTADDGSLLRPGRGLLHSSGSQYPDSRGEGILSDPDAHHGRPAQSDGSGSGLFIPATSPDEHDRPLAAAENSGALLGRGGGSPILADHEDIYSVWRPSALQVVSDGATLQRLSSDEHDRYISWLYMVRYRYLGKSVKTFMRIDIPRFSQRSLLMHPYLPVVLVVDGGTNEWGAVRRTERSYAEYRLTSSLASSSNDTGEMPFYYRDGDPMVAISFTQPGRGGVGEYGVVEHIDGVILKASPDPSYVDKTPDNTEGQDCAGDMTMAAMDAVMASAKAILEDMIDSAGAARAIADLRIVVTSMSFGLASAARWISRQDTTSGLRIHALVDWEGPASSLDITLASLCTDPFGLSDHAEEPPPWEVELASEPSYSTWSRWFGGEWCAGETYPDTFFFRPPLSVLAQLSGSESALGSSEPIASDPRTARYWEAFYGPSAWSPTMRGALSRFWQEREPVENLQSLTCPYIRIQAEYDHIQPDWLKQRHAIKALNAAMLSGQKVYFAGDNYYERRRDTPTPPDLLVTAFDDLDYRAWPAWIPIPKEWTNPNTGTPLDPESWSEAWPGLKYLFVLDLVRWAMEEVFDSWIAGGPL
jgi:hypothetical protein